MKDENILYGLAYECPTKQRQNDCPLMEIDHLSFKEKNTLSEEEKEAILKYHKVCSSNKIVD